MSRAAKDGNSFRREWDKEAFEKKAKERLDAELQLEVCCLPIIQSAGPS